MHPYGYVLNPTYLVDVFGLQGGGSYSKTRKTNTNGETNHIPAWNSIEIAKELDPTLTGLPTYGRTPSVHMDTPDHRNMTSTGSRRQSVKWRQRQSELIKDGKFGKAMEMDIREIKRRYGSKYNEQIQEMLDYALKKGYLKGGERNRLGRTYGYH